LGPALSELKLRREQVKSSVIESIGYDADTRVLEVEFRTGRVYQYFAVPPALHRDLLKAESIGEFFNRNIRSDYRCDEVTKEGTEA